MSGNNTNGSNDTSDKTPISTIKYGDYICTEYKYDFFVGKRDFVFEKPSENSKSQNPYEPFVVGRRDFIFPERECVEDEAKPIDLFYGWSLETDLEVPKLFNIDFHYGYAIEDNIQFPVLFDIEFYHGYDLQVIIDGVGFEIDFYYGNSLECNTLSLPLSMDFHYGWQINEVYAEVPYKIEEHYIGWSVEVEKLDIPIYLESDQYIGWDLDQFDLDASNLHLDELYYGISLEESKLSVPINTDQYIGWDVSVDGLDIPIYLEVDLYHGYSFDGVVGDIPFLESDQYIGWDITPFSENDFSIEFKQGYYIEDNFVIHHTNDTWNLGQIDSLYGYDFTIRYMSEVNHVTFFPYSLQYMPFIMSVSFNGTYETFFDVPEICCYHDKYVGGNDLYWEVGYEQFPNQEAGLNVGFRLEPVELTTMVNLEADIYYGLEIDVNEEPHNIINNIELSYGFSFACKFDWERVINMCPPSMLIYGDNVNIDLIDLKTNDCKHELLSYGWSLECETVSLTRQYGGDFYYGWNLDPRVTFDAPLEVEIAYGWWVDVDITTTPFLDADIYYGYDLDFRFYVEPIDLYYGWSIDPFNLVAKYYVEFLEDGCLDNEYIYTDEEGVRQEDMFIPTAIEFLPYRHDIKARCF